MKIGIIVALLAAAPAFAEPTVEVVPTCVSVDDETTRALFVRALERLDQLIVETGCAETITLAHERDGTDVHVRIASSTARRKLTVNASEDMLDVYTRMAKSLLAPPPAPEPTPEPTPEPDVDEPTETPRMIPTVTETSSESDVPAHQHIWYTRTGFGALAGQSAMSFASGWRRGSRKTVLDIGVAFLFGDGGTENASNLSARLLALRYSRPAQNASWYFGGGGSLGYSDVMKMHDRSNGGGFQLDSALGYEWNRTGSHRFSIETSVMLPLYTLDNDAHPASFVASFGIGM